MGLKKTKTELKDIVKGWLEKSQDFMKSQESWKILVAGIIIGIVVILFFPFIMSLFFITIVVGAVIYFLSPEKLSSLDNADNKDDNNDEDNKTKE